MEWEDIIRPLVRNGLTLPEVTKHLRENNYNVPYLVVRQTYLKIKRGE